jgi:AcrR family transcriptional regulator
MRRKDDEKQKSIKRAVVSTVLKDGMHGASISKIAKAAGVSPATVYVYYDNKDVMLRDIYFDYAEEIFGHLVEKLTDDMAADIFIDTLIREYYRVMIQQEEIYHFVEQFSSCPSLHQGCKALPKGPDALNAKIMTYKNQGSFINYDNSNIWAMIFYPVKGIAKKSCSESMTSEERLDEMIRIIQRALLK